MPIARLLAITLVLAYSSAAAAAAPRAGAEGADAGAEIAAAEPDEAGPRNTLTVFPMAALAGFYSFEYERAASDSVSLFVAPAYFRPTLLEKLSEQAFGQATEIRGLAVEMGARLFLLGTAPEGIWLAPAGEIGRVEVDFGPVASDAMGYALAGSAGFTWLIGDVVDLSLGAGLRHYRYQAEATAEVAGEEVHFEGGLTQTLPFVRFALGAAF